MRLLLTTILISIVTFINAQDIIIYQDGSEKQAKVLEINDDNVVFKKYSNLKGPEYTESKSNIFMIKYEGGESDVFKNEEKKSNSDSFIYSEISEGTIVPLYTARTISSKDMQVGSLIELRVKDPVVDENNYILIKANTIVYATINQISKAKTGGRAGSLNLLIQDIKDVYGQKVPAYLNMGSEGQNKEGAAWGIGLFLFWPALFLKGKEAEIQAGTLVNAVISESRKIRINPELKSNTNKVVNYKNETSQLNKQGPCGKKPKAPPTYNDPQFRKTPQYKVYYKKLKIWSDCTGE
jgi:hypothetical protein